jgi:hypothetical protein
VSNCFVYCLFHVNTRMCGVYSITVIWEWRFYTVGYILLIYCHNILGHLTIKENSSVRNGLMSELPAECSSCSEAEHKTATKVLNKCNGMGSFSEQQAAWCQGNSLCCSLFRLPFPQWSFLKEWGWCKNSLL